MQQHGLTKILVVVFILLVVIGLVTAKTLPKFMEHGFGGSTIATDLPPCGSETEFFTSLPVDLEEIDHVVPLGNLSPPAHTFPTDHIYFQREGYVSARERRTGTPYPVTVYSPGNLTITRITSQQANWDDGRITNDYSMHFTSCREFDGYYIHIESISGKLLDEFERSEQRCESYRTGPASFENCEAEMRLEVESGEEIGQVGLNEWRFSFDLGAHDMRTAPLDYANPDRWHSLVENVVCPLDYFTKDLKTRIGSVPADFETYRTIPPVCGEVEQDEPGTAQGVWFFGGTRDTYPEDNHLALVHDNIDPTKPIFSVGNSIPEIAGDTYSFEIQKSGLVNRDFNDVKPDGNIYCFENIKGRFDQDTIGYIILLKMENSDTLDMEVQSGNSCDGNSWEMTNKATGFDR